MKRVFFYFFLLICLPAITQEREFDIKAEGLINQSLRLLYIGNQNPLTINNYNDTNIFLYSESTYRIFRAKWDTMPNRFIVLTEPVEQQLTLKLFKRTLGDSILLDTFNFQVRRIVDPKAIFGNLVDDRATLEAILMQDRINIYMPAFLKIEKVITQFRMTVIKVDGTTYSITARGRSTFTKEQRQLISILKPGDKLLIDNIILKMVASGTISSPRMLNPIIINVKL